MDASLAYGSIGFGMVIGWVTYYTMRKNTKERTLADITVIISALIGPAVLAVFPSPATDKTTMFGYYGIGLAIGFFLYYIVYVLLLWKAPIRLLQTMFSSPSATVTIPTTTVAEGTSGGGMSGAGTKREVEVTGAGGGMTGTGPSKEDGVSSPTSRPAVGDKRTSSPEG
jgi:hypothetical protein